MEQRWIPRAVVSSGGAVVIIALVAGIIALYHAQTPFGRATAASRTAPNTHIPATISTPVPVGTPGLVGLPPTASDQGITLRLVDVTADPIETLVRVVISGSDPALFNPSLDDATLTDDTGQTIAYLPPGAGPYTGVAKQEIGMFDFVPLAQAQLTQPVHLTFTVHHITLWNGNPPAGPSPVRGGTWSLPFTVNPIGGALYHLHVAPSMQQGIGFQPQTLEVIAPSSTTGATGGIRLIGTFTGLPADALVSSFAGWSALPVNRTVVNPGGPVCFQPVPCTPIPERPLPRAEFDIPGFAPDIDPTYSISFPIAPQTATVGSNGAVQVEFLYRGQGTPTEDGTLTFAYAQIARAGGAVIQLPEWVIAVGIL